jgi:hypothetical protein
MDDIEKLKGAIEQGERDFTKLGAQFPDKSLKCIQKKYRELLRFESSHRSWSFDEDCRLFDWVAKCGQRWRHPEVEFRGDTKERRQRFDILFSHVRPTP